MSFRKQQVESLLKRAISQVLARQISDPRIAGLVSITRVDISPDFHDAFIYISVIPEKYQKRTVAGLRNAKGHIFNLVRKAVALKTVPNLDFRLDVSLKKESEVLDAIRRGIEHEKPLEPAAEDEDGPDETQTPQEPSPEDEDREE
jgi:ribosome-binding factor A